MFDLDELLKEASRPHVPKKPWMETKTFVLGTVGNLSQIVDACIASGRYALDIETTGLDNRVYNGRTVDHIVGFCLSPDGNTGYYIPVGHTEFVDNNIPRSVWEPEMVRLCSSPAKVIFHNGKFDQEFLEFNGGKPIGDWDDIKKWDDTLILAYLVDNTAEQKGLKYLSETKMGMPMIELADLFTEEERAMAGGGMNFSLLNPTWEPALWYACSDAICTYLLYDVLRGPALDPYTINGRKIPSQETVYAIEKLGSVIATRWMERSRVPINRDTIRELRVIGQKEWLPSLLEVYREVNKILGRDTTPGYVRLMSTEGSEKFDPTDVSETLGDRIARLRLLAEKRKMDPVDHKGEVTTLQKTVPHLLDKKQVEIVDFPIVYDILNPIELGSLLRELGVAGLKATDKSGKEDASGRIRDTQVKTSKDELNRVLEEAGDEYPFITKIKRFREIAKALSSNLEVLWEDTDPQISPDSTVRIGFNAWKTETGRFSTPTPKEKKRFTGSARSNWQSMPKFSEDDAKRPECTNRTREVVEAPDGHTIWAIDYSGEELRLATNFSGEPLWIQAFFECFDCKMQFPQGETVPPPPEPPPSVCPRCGSEKIGDLHTITAINVFGEQILQDKNEYKDKRNKCKALNFAMVYGGGASAAVRAIGCPKDEGWRIKNQFDKTYKGLASWWRKQHEFARDAGLVLTAFNRRIRLPDINNPNGIFRSKAERNATNSPIQGTGGDIMKFAMGLLYKEMKKRGWLNLVRMIISMHDELVFCIHDSVLLEAIPLIQEIMLRRTVQKMPFRIPLTCDSEGGKTWSVPWNLSQFKEWDEQAVKKIIDKAKKTKNGVVDDALSRRLSRELHYLKIPFKPWIEKQTETEPGTEVETETATTGVFVYYINAQDLTQLKVAALTNAIKQSVGQTLLQVVVRETGQVICGQSRKIQIDPLQFTKMMES